MLGQDEEAVAGRRWMEDPLKPSDGVKLSVVGGGPVVKGEDVAAAIFVSAAIFVAVCEGEAGLATVVSQEELAGGGRTSPGAAHGAAAEEWFRGQTHEDLPDDNLLRWR